METALVGRCERLSTGPGRTESRPRSAPSSVVLYVGSVFVSAQTIAWVVSSWLGSCPNTKHASRASLDHVGPRARAGAVSRFSPHSSIAERSFYMRRVGGANPSADTNVVLVPRIPIGVKAPKRRLLFCIKWISYGQTQQRGIGIAAISEGPPPARRPES